EAMQRSALVSVLLTLVVMTLLGVNASYGQQKGADFTLNDINGVRFSLSDFKGKVVLIDFFATWCPPCIDEVPNLRALRKLYPNDTLVMMSISIDPIHDTEPVLKIFAEAYGMTWIIASDTAGVANKYGIVAIPTIILIDQQGYIQSKHEGPAEKELLQSKIDAIVPEFTTPATVLGFSIVAALLILRGRKLRNGLNCP
nr:TlpA disulfide reductase family protein [Candidatus Njordarchaeum guaymaensis]